MLKPMLCLFIIFLASGGVTYACSPNVEYLSRPLAMKLKANHFFIGKVVSVEDDEVTFEVMMPGGLMKDKKIGDKIDMKRDDSQSTCGRKEFSVGEIWLYDGDDISFSPSQKLEPSDLKDGYGLEAVRNNLVRRVEPEYVTPKQPVKGDLPISGTYTHEEECGEADKALGYKSEAYSLEISKINPVTQMYKVDILMNICKGGHICSFSAEAPAYGYGEIVLPMVDEEGHAIPTCNVIVQQLSGVDDWPRLKAGEAKVQLSDYSCQSYLTCGSNTYLTSPVLQKMP